MSAFHRQPSRMYWESDLYSNPYYRPHLPHNHRAQSSSPGSQDSGFSDTETSPTNPSHAAKSSPKTQFDISVNSNNVTTIKVTSTLRDELLVNQDDVKTDVNANNLVENVKEKFTPTKSNLRQLFEDRYKNGGPGPGAKSVSPKTACFVVSTPVRRTIDSNICTEPATHTHLYNKRNSKVNRNLFKSIQSLERNEKHSNQYATTTTTSEHLSHNNTTDKNTEDDNNKSSNSSSNSSAQIPEETQSLPNTGTTSVVSSADETEPVNLTAPAILPEVQRKLSEHDVELCQTDADVTAGSKQKNISSECDSEVEEIFPQHTSTPKHGPVAIMKKERLRKKLHKEKLLLKYKDERVPPIVFNIDDYNDASLKTWYEDLQDEYETECMTALQGKSISGELSARVAKLAADKTRHLREILHDAIAIYTDIDQLNSPQLPSLQPHCSTLSTNIRSYLTKHPPRPSQSLTTLRHHCMELSTLKSTPNAAYQSQLAADFTAVHRVVLGAHARRYLRRELTAPRSELDVRAAVTGLTSVCLHYGEGVASRGVDLVAAFVDPGAESSSGEDPLEQGAVELLVTLCEISEGSSVRRAILRALATVCASGVAVGRFEASGGVEKTIVDVVTDDALPEVERIEAIALLAQITAPWIDQPPSSLPSIPPHLRSLIRSLTISAHTNTCRQNLLLCTAALANLTTLYVACVKHIIAFRTVNVLLKCLKNDGATSANSIEVYVLEQIAIVIANVSATEEGRSYLTATPTTSTALVCFLQAKPYTDTTNTSDIPTEENTNHHPDDVAVIQRLQQKAIIALSRLCSNPKSAHHVVKIGGVKRLVLLCREKGERYGSDAVLVAALATLRKISETCGAAIMTEQDTQELVEPRLLDSFLAYSAQNESLV